MLAVVLTAIFSAALNIFKGRHKEELVFSVIRCARVQRKAVLTCSLVKWTARFPFLPGQLGRDLLAVT